MNGKGNDISPHLFEDAEIVSASGVPLPSLRVLQTAGAIRSEKTSKDYGGFRRMWSESAILKAAIGGAMSEHFVWNIRLVAEAIAKTSPETWDALILSTTSEMQEGIRDRLIKASEHDWLLELVDRKYLFLNVPAKLVAILPDLQNEQTDLPIGFVVSKDHFQSLLLIMGTESECSHATCYRLSLSSHSNILSKATINIGMCVRAAWCRLHGHQARQVHAK